MKLQTTRLELRLQTPDEVLNWVESLPPEVRKEISNDWLARLKQLTGPDPWSCFFEIETKSGHKAIGSCGFKGPPNDVGMVEIAYGIDEPFRGQGFATEAAGALVEFASTTENVVTVRGNAKRENPASERVLSKLRFQCFGEFEEPDDGLVNRWEFTFNKGKCGATG